MVKCRSTEDKRVLTLDLAALLAAPSTRRFEDGLKSVLKEIAADEGARSCSSTNHTNSSGGRQGEGAIDAGNKVKPALARGELHASRPDARRISQAHREGRGARAARFQRSDRRAERGEHDRDPAAAAEKYELHHGVEITDPAIVAAASCRTAYIPIASADKAIDLID